MTFVEITRFDGHITKVRALGHSGYSESGSDIVCSAISSIIQTCLLGCLQILAINIEYEVNAEDGELYFSLGDLDEKKRHEADILLETMLLGLKDLYENYSNYITIKEKKDKKNLY